MPFRNTILYSALRLAPAIFCGLSAGAGAQAGGDDLQRPKTDAPVKEVSRINVVRSSRSTSSRLITFYCISPDSTKLAYYDTGPEEGERPSGELVLVDLYSGKEIARRRAD